MWAAGVEEQAPPMVTDSAAFLVDFLPVMRRKLTRSGFVIDHVHYFCNGLKPWIARRVQMERFVIRRDPRDISRIWVLDPDDGSYMPVPYRTLSYPAVSVWEHRAAIERLHAEGRAQVDEDALFRMVEKMRTITETASTTTRKARRNAERRKHSGTTGETENSTMLPPDERPPDEGNNKTTPEQSMTPFEVIEQW